jgi:acetyl esterase/lipase
MIPFFVTITVLLLLLLCLNLFVHSKTKKRDEKSPDMIPIGGMVSSEHYDYSKEADKKTLRSPIVRLMQLLWINTSKSDAKNHSTQTPPPGIKEITNIPYLNDGSIFHLLDVYYPENAEKPLPVIIDVHGGGWMYGDKELNKLYCLALASRGYLVFNMSYSLAPDVTVDAQLRDVMAALRWIGDHIGDYPCDPSTLILTGDSAGGQLASYAVALTGSERLRGVFNAEANTLRYTGLLLTSPVPSMKSGGYMALYMKRLWGSDRKTKECFKYANFSEVAGEAKFPKTYLITSAGDFLGHDQTVAAYETLKGLGVECKLSDFGGEEGKKLEHVFTVINPYNEIGRKTINEALEWLRS